MFYLALSCQFSRAEPQSTQRNRGVAFILLRVIESFQSFCNLWPPLRTPIIVKYTQRILCGLCVSARE